MVMQIKLVVVVIVDIGIFLSPINFSSVRISQLKVQWSENYRDQNVPFRKFQPEKRFQKILGDLFRVKTVKMGNYTIFQMFGKQEILQQMFRKLQISNRLPNRYFSKIDVGCPRSLSQIVFQTDIFRKLTLGAPVAGVAWWFWLDALSNVGGRGQRNRVEIARSRFCGLVAEQCSRQNRHVTQASAPEERRLSWLARAH